MGKSPQRMNTRYRGTLVGAAIADALAFPLRNYSRNFLLSVARPLTTEYEATSDGHYPPGQHTDDTQGWMATVESVLEARDLRDDPTNARLCVDYLIPLWRDLLVVDPDPEMTTVLNKVVKGIVAWDDAALPEGHATCGAVTRALPIGLWNCRTFDDIPRQVDTIVGVTHRDPRVLAVASGCAAAIASNVTSDELILGDFLDRISEAAAEFDVQVSEAVLDMPRLLSQTESRALEMMLAVYADDDHPPREDGLGDYVVPVLLFALYQFLKNPHDFERCVDRSLRLGGSLSTVASVAGAFNGSFNGFEHLPQRLVVGLVEGDRMIRLSDELFDLRRRVLRDRRTEVRDAKSSDDEPSSEDALGDDAMRPETTSAAPEES